MTLHGVSAFVGESTISTFRFYWVVAVSGAIFMAFEILSSRILSPHFGSSVYVWGSIISVFLASLSLGYTWGGRLADRQPRMATLGRLIVWAGVFQAVLLLAGQRLAGWLADLTGGTPAGTLLAAAVLFGPTSVLFGTVSPYAVRLAAKDLSRIGNVAGRLYALSTVGSLAGTLLCTFVLIPYLGLRPILGLLMALTAVTAGMALFDRLRREWPSAGLAGSLVALALTAAGTSGPVDEGVLYERITPYQTLRVIEADGVRYLRSDRTNHSAVRLADGEPALVYPRVASAALLYRPELDRLLVLGMGNGAVGTYLRRRLPDLEVDFVDIDPAVPEVARRFLLYEDLPGFRVTIADGRRFLAGREMRWDYVYCDVYIGLAIPFHLTTREFLREVKARLAPGGIFGINIAGRLDRPFPRAIYRTLVTEFDHVVAFAVRGSGNHLVLAFDGPAPSDEVLAARAGELDRRAAWDPQMVAIARWRLPLDVELSEAQVLTDAFAPVEHLVLLSAEAPVGPAAPE